MRIYRLLQILFLFVMPGGFSINAQADEALIKVTGVVEVENEVLANGIKVLKRTPPDKVIPGTEVIFTNTFSNVGGKVANNIVINNPIPKNTLYQTGSAFGKDTEILFSVDGGNQFSRPESLKVTGSDGKPRNALPRDYTDIRWIYKGSLSTGKLGEVGFRALVK